MRSRPKHHQPGLPFYDDNCVAMKMVAMVPMPMMFPMFLVDAGNFGGRGLNRRCKNAQRERKQQEGEQLFHWKQITV